MFVSNGLIAGVCETRRKQEALFNRFSLSSFLSFCLSFFLSFYSFLLSFFLSCSHSFFLAAFDVSFIFKTTISNHVLLLTTRWQHSPIKGYEWAEGDSVLILPWHCLKDCLKSIQSDSLRYFGFFSIKISSTRCVSKNVLVHFEEILRVTVLQICIHS